MYNPGPDLLQKYFAGQCTEQEKVLVDQWLNSNQSNNQQTDIFRGISKKELKESIWNKIKPISFIPGSNKVIPIWYTIAASIILAIGIHTVWHLYLKPTKNIQIPSSCYLKFATPKGQKAKITLSDGTVIQLNTDSHLQYPAKFTGSERIVYLEGEAFFKVTKDTAHPFIIYTDQTRTTVLGTSFNLKARKGETSTTLTVQEGKVKFSGKKTPVKSAEVFTINQSGVFNSDKLQRTNNVVLQNDLAWKDERLVFDNALFDNIIPDLERWYNIEITIKKKELTNYRYTGSFKNPSLHMLLKSMGTAMNFNYTINERKVMIY